MTCRFLRHIIYILTYNSFYEILPLKVGEYSIIGKPHVQKKYYLLSLCTVRLVHRVFIIII